MKTNAPRIDIRSFQDLLKQMQSMVPFYTPEWNPNIENEQGKALMQIYLHMLEQVITRLNQVPNKNFVAFLNMLGIKLRPAQSAKAVITFKLAEGTQEHVTVPKGTLLTGEGTDGEEVTFETQSDLRVTPSLLKEIYSSDAVNDRIFAHTDQYINEKKFHILSGNNQQEHALYIGHEDLFNLTSPTEINVEFILNKGATGGVLIIVFEYWDGDSERWIEMANFDADKSGIDPDADGTALLNKSGKMRIEKTNVGEVAIYELLNQKSRWIRCRLKNKLIANNTMQLPEINSIQVSVNPIKPISAELAFNNDIPIDLNQKFKPFGELPVLFDTLYIASDEAFSKKSAEITIEISGDNIDPADVSAVLSWEFWNGKSWRVLQDLNVDIIEDNISANITFDCPVDIEKIKVNGEKKYWIRVRIIDGDYGKEIEITPLNDGTTNVKIESGVVEYPTIDELKISYEGKPVRPQQCFSLNNMDYQDHMVELLDPSQTFTPFKKLPEKFQGLFLGFDNLIVGGPIRILFNLTEQILTEKDTLKIQWFFWKGDHWSKINSLNDGTEHLTRIDLLEFSVPVGFESRRLFDKQHFWIKANVIEGTFKELNSREDGPKVPQLIGVFPNSTDAIQASVINDEVLGTSDLTANQAFQLFNSLIISQTLCVSEPTYPLEDEVKLILQEEGNDAIEPIHDHNEEILNYRIRWHEVDDFYLSGPKSRHYIVDKRQGIIQFGDGINGLVPPVGRDNIRVSYRYGGGVNGNVDAGKISSLKNAIPFVDEVSNHLPADGGADTETLEEILERGPRRLKNRDRAVTSDDYAALARNASRKIKRAKCLPNTNADGEFSIGHVSVIIVPDTQKGGEPVSRLLVKTVLGFLEKYSANLVSAPRDIDVRGAHYIEITIEPTVVPVTLEASARVDTAIVDVLNRYIHPLTGGRQANGWVFGKSICRSEIIALLEGVTEVDYVKELVIRADGKSQAGDVKVVDSMLPFSGEHKVNLHFGSNDNTAFHNMPEPTCQSQINEFCKMEQS